jgi:hypothetical protein
MLYAISNGDSESPRKLLRADEYYGCMATCAWCGRLVRSLNLTGVYEWVHEPCVPGSTGNTQPKGDTDGASG